MPTVRGILNEARELVINGDFSRARGLCQKVLARYPKHVEAHILLGEAAREAGEFDEARRLFLTVLALDPENGISYWALGLVAEQEGQRELALSLFERALEYLPGDSDLWQAIRRIRHDRPETSPGGLGRLYLRQGHFRRARGELEAALNDQPSRLDLRVALAEALWRMGLLADARTRCEEVLAASPDCLKALLILADCNRQQGRFGVAERLLQHAALVDPDGDVAATLFIDSDPPWIRHEPVGLEPPKVEEPPRPKVTAGTWIEQLAQVGQPAPEPPEPKLSDWFAYPADEELIGVKEDSLIDDESFAPWHDLLTLPAALDPEVETRLQATLADIVHQEPDGGDGWHEISVQRGGVRESMARSVETRDAVRATGAPTTPGLVEADSADVPDPASTLWFPPVVALADFVSLNADAARKGLDEARESARSDDVNAAIVGYLRVIRNAPSLVGDVLDGLNSLVAAHPDDAIARRAMGTALVRSGDFRRAVDEYARSYALRRAPE